jgi:DNA-binding transcriptional ArsR family regulator
MLNEKALAREGRGALQRYLEEAGIRPRWLKERHSGTVPRPDAELEVRLPGGGRERLVVEFKANARRAPLEASLAQLRNWIAHSGSSSAIPLLFSSHLGRPMREWLRSQQVWFADLAGNRFFRGPGLLIDREVAKKPAEAREPLPSIFADRNSLVLRYLLPRPSEKIGVRELARRVRLSPSAASLVLRRLREMGYLGESQGEIRLLDRESLLEEWVSFYRPRFRSQPESRLYVHARGAEAIIEMIRAHKVARENRYGLSLHAGASLVAPFVQFREVHIYARSEEVGFRSRLVKALGAENAVAEANLVLLAPFYRGSIFFESRLIRGVRVVSDLQLYLDLSCFPQRGIEQAQVLLARRLRPGWSGK